MSSLILGGLTIGSLLLWLLTRPDEPNTSSDPGTDPSGASPGRVTQPGARFQVPSVQGVTGFSAAPSSVRRWVPIARRIARAYRVPASLVLAVIWQESAGDPYAQGSAGEIGLMQVTPIAAEDVGRDALTSFDVPEKQIDVGAAFLDRSVFHYCDGMEDLRCGLRTYNEGPPPHNVPSSNQYATDVLSKWNALR